MPPVLQWLRFLAPGNPSHNGNGGHRGDEHGIIREPSFVVLSLAHNQRNHVRLSERLLATTVNNNFAVIFLQPWYDPSETYERV